MSSLLYPFPFRSLYPRWNKWAHLAANDNKCTKLQQLNNINVANDTQRRPENNGKQ
jgi:hypothetical protein